MESWENARFQSKSHRTEKSESATYGQDIIPAILNGFGIPAVERMYNIMKKYQVAFTETTVENKKLKQENAQLEHSLEKATQESTLKQLADAKLRRNYADAVAVLDRIPKEVLTVYARGSGRKEQPIDQNL